MKSARSKFYDVSEIGSLNYTAEIVFGSADSINIVLTTTLRFALSLPAIQRTLRGAVRVFAVVSIITRLQVMSRGSCRVPFEREGERESAKKQEGIEKAKGRRTDGGELTSHYRPRWYLHSSCSRVRTRALYSTFVWNESSSIPLLPRNRIHIPSMFSYLWAKEMSYFFKVDII